MAVVLGSASAQDSGSSGANSGAGASRQPGNLLNGGASSFQPPALPLLTPEIGSGMAKAGGIVTVADVGVDLYQGKKSKTQIAIGAGAGLAKGFAYSQAGGLIGGLIGLAAGGPPGAAAGYEIGVTGTTAILTAKGAMDTGEKLSQAVADYNVKKSIDNAFGPNTWQDLPPVPGSPAAMAQGWVELPPVPGSPAAKDQGWIELPPVPGSPAEKSSISSLLGPVPPRDPAQQWPICPKCGKRHDPNEK